MVCVSDTCFNLLGSFQFIRFYDALDGGFLYCVFYVYVCNAYEWFGIAKRVYHSSKAALNTEY